MAHSQEAAHSDNVKRRGGHEGPKNHLIAFVISIVLTILAFVAVSAEGVSKEFVVGLIVLMAFIQVIVQLGFWMHLKDRGHFWPILGMVMGATVVLTAVVTTVYWIWYV